jgi:hypothetical protein
LPLATDLRVDFFGVRVLNRVFPNWKIISIFFGVLVFGFLVGDAYRGAIEDEQNKVAMKVFESASLDGASVLLIAMKRYSPDCARSMVKMRVEGNLVRAQTMTVPGYPDDILEKSIVRAKKALAQEDKSGLGFSGDCDVLYK